MWTYGAIAIFGVLGCWARFAQTNLVQTVYGRDFPYATLSINVMGSFIMGFLFVETLERLTLPPSLRTGILTGFIGGYTTFSTFEMETLLLAEGGELFKAALYMFLSVALGFLAAFEGAYIARNL
ncbi:fluoride efflux transporter CrcB [Rhodoblastus sp.]|uniref:fluoride efflux transporter CrcB n=1 Tax=Rhodoblastus sp. TaxID=1962975 RepID=UPI00261AD34A|nr:fluoride efflux transporter CrcB [Rhodoblastus sp.]